MLSRHAHYNLSQRHRSILIEEDGRGAGVNQALGLKDILAYDCRKQISSDIFRRINNRVPLRDQSSQYVCGELSAYMDTLEAANYKQMEWAFERMQYYYGQMREHLSQIKDVH